MIFLVLLSAGSLAGELINKRFSMSDLEVYHKTSVRLLQGEELYRSAEEDPWEFYVFKYSPPAAFLFLPFVVTGFSTARFLYWAFLTFILGHTLYLLYRIFIPPGQHRSRIALSLVLAMLIVGAHFFRELHLGQVNLLLLWLYVIAVYAYKRRRSHLLALVLAISIFIKPFALIFLPFLLLSRRYRSTLLLFAFSLLIFFLPMLFYPDLERFFGLYASWISEIGIELGAKQDLLMPGNHTIFSVLARYSPLRMLPLEGFSKLIYQGLVLCIIAALLLWYIVRSKDGESFLRIFIILIAMIPLLAFTSYNAFIFSLPLVTFLLFRFRDLSIFYRVLFIISCIMIGGNIYDLSGPVLFDLFWEISVYSWGTIGLIVIAFMNWGQLRVNPSQ